MLRSAILLLASLATMVLGLAAPHPGYGVQDFTWEVQAFANGTKVNITGTVEKVLAELAKINPDFPRNEVTASNLAVARPSDDNGAVCLPHDTWQAAAKTADIRDGINYLRSIGSKPVFGPGPNNCGRVSCSYDAAITVCNDKTQDFSLPDFGVVADCAQAVVDACTYKSDLQVEYTYGKYFHPNLWHCAVSWDPC